MKKTQERIEVIDPATGEETFVVAQLPNNRKLVKRTEIIHYNIMGLTQERLATLKKVEAINYYESNGKKKSNQSKNMTWIDLREIEAIDLSLGLKGPDEMGFPKNNSQTANEKV